MSPGFLQMLALVLCLTLTPTAQAVSNSGFPSCVPRSSAPGVGLTLTGQSPLDARTTDLAFSSMAMGATEHVAVMLPVGYTPTRRYPTLYLLAGAFGSDTDYLTHGVEPLVGTMPMIVVMTDADVAGSYTDWFGQMAVVGPATPPPAWETYHTAELIPWIDAHYPTIASAGGRAVAGLSMGGLGALKYPAAHPGLFGAAGSFSGNVDLELSWPVEPAIEEALWSLSLLPAYGPPAFCTWGDPVLQHGVWQRNDPTAQAAHLKGVQLVLASGNGNPGPLDSPSDPNQQIEGSTEKSILAQNQALVQALDAAGIPHTDDFYGNGTHSWPYWIADLGVFLPWLTTHLPGLAS